MAKWVLTLEVALELPCLQRVHDNSFLWVASFLLLIETEPEKILYIYISSISCLPTQGNAWFIPKGPESI